MNKHKKYKVEIFVKKRNGNIDVLSTVLVSSFGLRIPGSANFDNLENGKFVFNWVYCDANSKERNKVTDALREVRGISKKSPLVMFDTRLVMEKDEFIDYCNARIPPLLAELQDKHQRLTTQLSEVENEITKLQQHQIKIDAFVAQQNKPTRGKGK